MDRWTEMEVLVQIAETGTLGGAAEALSLSTSSASRYLASLEDRLGAALVMRNTRRLQLTDTGRAYLARLRAALEAGDDFALSALNTLASLSASLTVGLAALQPGAEAEALWAAANLEEDWQAELWGKDWEAEERRAKRLATFSAAMDFARLARS